jgi:4-diphosphocytidyl-2C-methyl-D-erythritol kinase
MTGSGATVFGLFADAREAEAACLALGEAGYTAVTATPI